MLKGVLCLLHVLVLDLLEFDLKSLIFALQLLEEAYIFVFINRYPLSHFVDLGVDDLRFLSA